MSKDMYSAAHTERQRDLLAEVEQARLARQASGHTSQPGLSRRAAGHLGDMLVAVGTHLKHIEQERRMLAGEAMAGNAEQP